MTATATLTPAWNYVDQHLPLLAKYATGRRFRPAHADVGDYHHDLLLAIVDKFERFESRETAALCELCGLRGCSTWLGWQARAVATTHNRRRTRRLAEDPVDELVDVATTHYGPAQIERVARIAQVLERATEDERAAARTVLEGLDERAIKATLGVTRPARDFRLRKLARRLNP